MATIRVRKKKNGDTSYRAEIVIKRQGRTVHRESRTFHVKKVAKAWGIKRQAELQVMDVFDQHKPVLIETLLNDYLREFSAGRSKRYDLIRLSQSDIAQVDAYRLSSKDIIKHCQMRLQTTKPQTVKNDVIWLRAALDTMKGVQGHAYSMDMFTPAYAVLRKEGIIGKSDQRDRRPTSRELWLLSRHFKGKPHYLHVIWFAIFSARRLSEITKLRWDDMNHDNRSILVRDMKTPNKEQLNLRAKLSKSAYKLIMRQPKTSEIIFNLNPKSISRYFTQSCKLLGIEDLRFHDLRHEAVTRFFLAGLNVPQVQQISLHQSWSSLAVYTNLISDDIDI